MVLESCKKVGRLILATLLLCGVGLFLCANTDVKAADPSISMNGVNIGVTLENTLGAALTNPDVIVTLPGGSKTVAGSGNIAAGETGTITADLSTILSDKSYFTNTGTLSVLVKQGALEAGPFTGPNVSKITVAAATGTYAYETSMASFPGVDTVKVSGRTYGATDTVYAIAGEKYEVKTKADSTKYYEYVSDSPVPWYQFGESKGTMGSSDLDLKVQYFPKIDKIVVGKTTAHLPETTPTGGLDLEIPYDLYNGATAIEGKDLETLKANMAFKPTAITPANITKISTVLKNKELVLRCGDSTAVLANSGNNGPGSATIGMGCGYLDGTTFKQDNTINVIPTASVTNGSAVIYAYATGWGLSDSTSVTASKKATASYKVTFSPKGADQDAANYSIKASTFKLASNAKDYVENVSYSWTEATGGTFTFKTKSKKGSTTVSLDPSFYDKTYGNLANTVTITVDTSSTPTDVDPEESVKKINKAGNYITVGYELNLEDLVRSNLVDSDGKAISTSKAPKVETITIDDEKEKYIEVKSSFKLLGKETGKVTITVELDDGTTLDDVVIYVYPKPTIKYNSNHTVTLTVPAKVSTGVGDTDTNLDAGKGFKLQLTDNSGNVLYEYDKSKYQTVISTVKDPSSEYTVTASDIEGMVTAAGTNGKFSADTTAVKFRMVPMGYKQGTSSEVVVTKDDVNAITDATTVYKVTATGANFTDSSAYGLEGQTVNLTATPATGFTFASWSDGETKNPRPVVVSASGTRTFTPQATAGGAGAGGYDDVPKTAESNSAIWLIVFMVFAVMGTAYALYLQLKAATSKNGK